ncbi:MAG: hypothetical protein HFI13_15225 [Lachnospiraceae bacterium]|nr:hypothetical protein [Lachnospiraceae bacterium]
MAAQLDYGYGMSKGVPGGKYDLSSDEVITRTNEEEDGVLRFGMAAMVGTTPGTTVKVAGAGATKQNIEGIVLAAENTEQDRKGRVVVPNNASVGIMTRGKIWGRISSDAVPVYKNKAYVVIDGEEAGSFTSNSAEASVYLPCDAGTSGALEVVADDTASPTSAQIKVSDVTPVSGDYVPAVGDHVEKKQIHGTTVDIGAVFGTETDDGIAVIILG